MTLTLLWTHFGPRVLVCFLKFAPMGASPVPTAPTPIAIIGMSGSFPQAPDVQSLWSNLLAGRDCIGEIPASRWDWQTYFGDPATSNPNKTNVKWAGILEGIELFDPLFFGISPREAEQMDPQQRLLMMYVWKAIEDAGYAASDLSGTNTALFIGTTSSGYSERLSRAHVTIEGYSSTGQTPSVGPGRMSYFLDLHGPSEAIETACSSSLVAIHRGVNAIESGQCSMAIVGGVNTLVSPELHISYSKAGMLSEDGRCKTFSAQANGYARGEGIGMLVLKRLSDAEQAGDHIYGVIRGSAENHGGRASSLTAPNPRAQADLLIAAYRKAGIDPHTVSYIEAHGTGTVLGDPIEINGLKTAFSELRTGTRHSPYGEEGEEPMPQAWCGIGSVKSNIGHLELAAGVVGVIKVLLQMQHKQLVKSLHCEQINPHIQLEGSPFSIVQENCPWEAQRDGAGNALPRRAGVSSFGFGGTNAHVVLEEYVPRPQTIHPSSEALPKAIIVLSAKSQERLHEQVRQLLAWIAVRTGQTCGTRHRVGDISTRVGTRHDPYSVCPTCTEEPVEQGQDQSLAPSDRHEAPSLRDLAYTLQVGREAMEERLALQVSSLAELEEKLRRYLQEPQGAGDWYRGQVKRYKETVALLDTDEELQEAIGKWLQRGKYEKLLEWWVKGLRIDWKLLYTVGAGSEPRTGSAQGAIPTAAPALPHRISLPTYPFALERYWVEEIVAQQGKPVGQAHLWDKPTSEASSSQTSTPSNTQTLLLTPGWKEEEIPTLSPAEEAPIASQHLVLLCELPSIEASRIQAQMTSGGLCMSLPRSQQRREQRFQDMVVQLIQEVQHLLRSRLVEIEAGSAQGTTPAASILVQVVVASREEPSFLEALVGVLRTAQWEYPKLRGQLIDVEREPEERELLAWLRENEKRPHEPHIRYRDGKRWVRQWLEVSTGEIGDVGEASSPLHNGIMPIDPPSCSGELASPTSPPNIPWKEGGCYLITGGAGGIARRDCPTGRDSYRHLGGSIRSVG